MLSGEGEVLTSNAEGCQTVQMMMTILTVQCATYANYLVSGSAVTTVMCGIILIAWMLILMTSQRCFSV